MIPSLASIALLACAPLLGPGPSMSVELREDHVDLRVDGHDEIFLGGVIASLSDQTAHYLVGLPPLLGEAIPLGAGVGYPDGGYVLTLPKSNLPGGVPIYVQGISLTERGLGASDVVGFTTDDGAPR